MILSLLKKLAVISFLVSGGSYAADIGYKGEGNVIWIVGEIDAGDAEKFENALASPPKEDGVIQLHLASGGGDVLEAMKIGRLVRRQFIPAFESTAAMNGRCVAVSLEGPTEELGEDSCGCHSSCFIIWAASPYRNGGSLVEAGPDGVGVHRPRFDKDYFSGLDAGRAEGEYRRLTNIVKQFLREMGIPDELAETMFEVSSEDVYLLSATEIDSLRAPPAIAEWLISKCGKASDGDRSDYEKFLLKDIQGKLDGTDYLSETERRHYQLLDNELREKRRCEVETIKAEQRSRRRLD